MGFRIKARYELNVDYNSETKTWTNSFPEFTYCDCDDRFITNNEKPDNTMFVQADRLRFCNIFNVTDQNITYDFHIENTSTHEKKIFFIKRGSYTAKELQTTLNSLDERIQFTFHDRYKGSLTVTNKTTDNHCEIMMNKNLLLITGLIDTFILLRHKKEYFGLLIEKNANLNALYNVMRTVREIKLYSKYIFNFKTEMCSKLLSDTDLKSLSENNSKMDVDFTISSLNSKLYKVDRFNLENTKFYLVDFLDQPVYFDFCEISVFFSNKG